MASQVTPAVESLPEGSLGGLGFSGFFATLISDLSTEQIIKRSPRGQKVGELLDQIKDCDYHHLAVHILTELSKCLCTGRKHKLPSLAQSAMWTAFHKMRAREDIRQTWKVFITSNVLDVDLKEYELSLQLLLDRGMKKLIKNSAELLKHHQGPERNMSLTIYESNAVRYMSGYVAVKLLKKYRRSPKNPKIVAKHKLFVDTLEKMKACEQPGNPNSVAEYSTLWLELIDRGGLYQINDTVFKLMEGIEIVTRRHLSISHMETGVNIISVIREEAFNTKKIMDTWEEIADNFPPIYEKYSLELLSNIMDLWINVRANAFAKGWTMNFERRCKKGTRKSLQQEMEA